MKKFIISYAITGRVAIEADTESEAIEKLDEYTELELYENANPSEITDILIEDSE